jgi:hypothetical protein
MEVMFGELTLVTFIFLAVNKAAAVDIMYIFNIM